MSNDYAFTFHPSTTSVKITAKQNDKKYSCIINQTDVQKPFIDLEKCAKFCERCLNNVSGYDYYLYGGNENDYLVIICFLKHDLIDLEMTLDFREEN